jgi:hypothetical protein
MQKLIACCGLDCNACDARIATINNDNELRKTTSEKWKKLYNAPGMTAEMINCTGCMEEGAKIAHCAECEIRNCVIAKGYETCSDCKELETCTIVSAIHKYAPDALQNLMNLRN